MIKKPSKNMEEWNTSKKEVINKCPYFPDIEPQIGKVKELNIPPLLKLFLNEAISDFIFGMYTSTIILCRTACEIGLKYYAIEIYLQITPKEIISRSVIDKILESDLSDLELILDYHNKSTGKIKAITGEVKKLGNIHVHGNIDKMIEKYLVDKLTKKSLVDYCLNLKKIDYLMSPEGSLKYMMFEGEVPELDEMEINEEEAHEILKQFPEVIGSPRIMPITKNILSNTLKLYEEIFGNLLSKKEKK